MKKIYKQILLLIAVISFVVYIAYYSGLKSWKTQYIVYQHKYKTDLRIEFQVQKQGRIGYTQRIVIIKENFMLDDIGLIDTTTIKKSHWLRVEKYINEMGK